MANQIDLKPARTMSLTEFKDGSSHFVEQVYWRQDVIKIETGQKAVYLVCPDLLEELKRLRALEASMREADSDGDEALQMGLPSANAEG